MTEYQLLIFLIEILVLLAAARLGGEVANRLGLPHLVGELIAGIMLGPSLLGWVWPAAFDALFPAEALQRGLLDATAWIGVVFLALLAGLATRLGLLRGMGSAVFGSWVGGFGLPFACGFALGMVFPQAMIPGSIERPVFALFISTAMSITAIPVIARILMDLGIAKTRVGVVVIASALADDTVGWVMLSIVAGLATGGVESMAIARTVALTIGFVGLAFTVGRRATLALLTFSRRSKLPYAELSGMFMMVLASGAVTQAIGVHLVLGVFVAAILIGQDPDLTEESTSALRGVGMGIFVPVFFASVGLKVDLTSLRGPALMFTLIALVVACGSKVIGAGLGARLGGMSAPEALSIGLARNARGAMELVIAAIGLAIGILNPSSYAMIVLIAVVTTVMTAPLLRWSSARHATGGHFEPSEP